MKCPYFLAILIGIIHCLDFNESEFFKSKCGRDLYDFKIAYNPKMEEVGMTNLTTIKCSFIGIHENKELKKLNIPAFKFASPSAENLGTNNTEIEIQIDSEKYGFCITSVEMCNFINIENVNLKKLGGGICEPGIQPSSGKLCNASYEVFMETEIQDGCTQIFGKLVINPKNVQNVQKLSSVEIIFGVLYIEETNLTTIDFLGNLKYISALGYNYPAITVQNNPFLSNFSFPNLKMIFLMKLPFLLAILTGIIYCLDYFDNSEFFESKCGSGSFVISYNSKMEEIGMTNLTTINCSLIDIHGNQELKRLNNLKFQYASPFAAGLIYNTTKIEITVDSSKYGFCLTSMEMYAFMNIENVDLRNLRGKICEPGIQPSSGKLCNASYGCLWKLKLKKDVHRCLENWS
ncbi:hypothetical protein B9Z55_017949 [Caenorhabditis nigoni]|uniref:Receptor L-domain domain-containing protein n=1 Tax=Caenorhabditis nigoni TaxID=1611254 RepID=A0A2G5TCE1_9PELO|nr:hypothetical protein B9Z55_017949 [Caenorhabditis nigoni]